MLYTTKLDLIANGEINNQGICWAATGASIINYKRGGTVKCNARKVYYDLKKKYNADPVWKYSVGKENVGVLCNIYEIC